MGFKEVQDLNPDTVISLGGKNSKTNQVEGYYLGKRSVADKKKKSGESYIYVFQTPKGTIGVWGKTDLDRKMSNVTLGVMVRATVTGTRPTPNGPMYTYKVEFDSSNTIEVDEVSTVESTDSEETYESDEGSEDTEETSSDEGEEVLAQQAAQAAAARAAKVKALLNGKGKKTS